MRISNTTNIDFDQIFNNIKQRTPLQKKQVPRDKNLKIQKNIIYCPLQVQDDTQIVQYGSWLK